MQLDFMFFFNCILLGVGLAMDAFSVSLANGLNEPRMGRGKLCAIAGTFGFFQALMPMLGWICVHTIVQYFQTFEKLIPWIALALLGYIGGKMLFEGIAHRGEEEHAAVHVGLSTLLMQGVATSIDALSVGFTIADYSGFSAFICCVIIAVTTFVICMGGLYIGKRFGTRLADRASILGGVILILIGIEIFLTGILA